jgi:hypothetical protein
MLRRLPVMLLVFCVIGSAHVYNVTEPSHTETKTTRNLNDVDSEAVHEDYVFPQDWFVAPPLLPILLAASDNIRSPRCRNQSRLYLQELRNVTLWAAQSK